MSDIEEKIKQFANQYAEKLDKAVRARMTEMQSDDVSHYLIYRVLGIMEQEGRDIDLYQNKGRFLYKYAGSFLEDVTKLCFKESFPHSCSLRIPNTQGSRPKTFQIDCLVDNYALEIKWRDATTDGDHITKEHSRIKAISDADYIPVRVMFYYPNREQAIKVQKTLETLYCGINGEYYHGDAAWQYVRERTGVDLKKILEEIAKQRAA